MSAGEKVPLPLVVHWPWPVPPVIVPPRLTASLFAQTVTSLPAWAVAGVVIITVIESLTWPQLPLFVEVSTSVTDPASESALVTL